MKPFKLRSQIVKIYDNGVIYDPFVLQISDKYVIDKVKEVANNIMAVCNQIGYVTKPNAIFAMTKAIIFIKKIQSLINE